MELKGSELARAESQTSLNVNNDLDLHMCLLDYISAKEVK